MPKYFYIVTCLRKEYWFDDAGTLKKDAEQWIGYPDWPYTRAEARIVREKCHKSYKIFQVGLPFNNFIKQVK